MAKNEFEARVLARLDQQVLSFRTQGGTPFEQRVRARLIAAQLPEEERGGFFARVNRFAENIFVDPDVVAGMREGQGFVEASAADRAAGLVSPRDVAQTRNLLTGIAGPIIKGAQAIAQIPGLFTDVELPTDRVAQFLERARLGLVDRAEEAALTAGLDAEAVADAHLFGEIVGFTAPVVASLKAARIVTGIRGPVISLARNLKLDTAAGLIFGSTLVPEEELKERVINTLRESAVFGVGGLMINGLVFAATGMKFARAATLQREADLIQNLNRIARGERVVLGEEGVTIAQLMSEEGFLAASPEAQVILESGAFDSALIEAIRGTAEAGMSRGFVRQLGNDFGEVSLALDRFRNQFPALKFDVVKRGTAFDVHFGLTGLNNKQRSQLAREGRFAGQLIQKGDSYYSYVRSGKKGRIVVSTIDGRTTTLKDTRITDIPVAAEEVPLPTVGEALYEDFREFAFGKMRAASAASGGLSETDVIRFIRQGQLDIADDATRLFESPGAITHPSEIAGEGVATTEQFVAQFFREGSHGNGLLEPTPIRRMDDVFEAWLKEKNLSPTAEDAVAFRTNFFQRMRSDIWALVPDADLKAMRSIQEETFRLLESKELPFDVVANSKGFHVERTPAGEITLRDINTGARLTFISEEVAERALQQVIRSEKDPLFDFLTPGAHGGQAFTGGFDPTDGVFTFDVNVAPEDFLRGLPVGGQALTNRRDYVDALERVSGVPLFNQGFALIDEGVVRMKNRLEPIAEEIGRTWKGISRDGRKQVAEFWARTEGTDLKGTALLRAARSAGLSSRQIQAFNRARKLFDFGAEQMGLPESRFISNYYSRIQPAMARDGRVDIARLLSDDPIATKEFQFWAEMQRTGELPQVELDPEIVMHKYFRSLIYKQEVAPFEQNIRKMMNLRISDLTATQQTAVLSRALPGTTAGSHVFPQEVRGMLQEYITNIRGDTSAGFVAARRMTTRAFEAVGIKADPRLFDELHSTYLSAQYGAAIGLRLVLMNRNATQNLWTMYTRVGAKHGSESLRRSLTQVGYDEALAAAAIRSVDVSIPQGDAIFSAWFKTDIARGSGPLSIAAASMIRQSVRLGRMTRKAAQKFLVPYGSGEQINRAWAYHWQKLHTEEWLTKFDSGSINWDTFLEDGLPFFSSSIKRGFRERFDRLGREAALQWIGKQAADEAHFIYGSASTPTWMQRPFGRLFSVFGQWPLWAKQLYFSRMAHATPKQIGQFWARTAALTGVFANMSVQTGVSMWNWVAPRSIGFSGGPSVDMAITAREIWSGPLDQKAAATKRLGEQVGALALPGQLFYLELGEALDQNDPAQAALRLTLGRSADVGNYNWDFTMNPDVPPFTDAEPRLQGLPMIGASPGRR